MKKIVLSLLITMSVTTSAFAESMAKNIASRSPDVGFFVNVLAHNQTKPIELKNFKVSLTGKGYDFQYQASAVSHLAGRDEVRFALSLPPAAFNQDLTLKASFEYPGKPACNIVGNKPVRIESGKKQWIFWNIEPADCTGKITTEKPWL